MKYRTVELIFIWIIYLALLGRNTYKHNITYIPKKHIDTTLNIYLHTLHHRYIYIYITEAHTDTGTYILYHIHTEEVTHRHYNFNRSYINIHSHTRFEFNYLLTVLSKLAKQNTIKKLLHFSSRYLYVLNKYSGTQIHKPGNTFPCTIDACSCQFILILIKSINAKVTII